MKPKREQFEILSEAGIIIYREEHRLLKIEITSYDQVFDAVKLCEELEEALNFENTRSEPTFH